MDYYRVCNSIWMEELGRPIDPSGLQGCTTNLQNRVTAAQIRRQVQQSPEWIARHAPPAPTPPNPPAALTPRLHVHGERMHTPDHRVFQWRGLMAFQLLDRVADGQVAESTGYVKWAQSTGFNVLRVLASNHWAGLMDLTPEQGWEAMPRLFDLARTHGMYVQVVALAGTDGWTTPRIHEQVRRVGELCAASDNCILEIANEPYHGSQSGYLKGSTAQSLNYAHLRELRLLVPGHVPVALGASKNDEGPDAHALGPGADFVVLHLNRSRSRWDRTRRVRELEMVADATGKYVVDNEPIGAGETLDPGRRDNLPAVFFAQGVLARVFNVGSTFHCSDCLYAKIPGPVQQESAREFVRGNRLWEDGWEFQYANAGRPPSPIARVPVGAVRAYSAGRGGRWWTVIVGLDRDSPV
jgi:hypothetical protein